MREAWAGGMVDAEQLLEMYGVDVPAGGLAYKRIPFFLQLRLYLRQAGLDALMLPELVNDLEAAGQVRRCLEQAYRDVTENGGSGCAVAAGCSGCSSGCG